MKFNLAIFFILTVILIFLQDFTIQVGTQQLYICSGFVLMSLFFIVIKRYRKIFTLVPLYIIKTPILYLILFILWIVITAFFAGSLSTIIKIQIRTFLIWGLVVIPTIFFTIYSIPNLISYKRFFKIFLILYQFIMYYGIFDFLGKICHIKIIGIMHNIVCSRAMFSRGGNIMELSSWERATSIFFEPSFYATFIFLFLPFAYLYPEAKNKYFKIYLIALTWLNLILTMSPIYIIASLIYTIVFYRKNIIRYVLKYCLVSIISIILTALLLTNFIAEKPDFISKNKVWSRIEKTILSFGSLETLSENEASLATRFITSINGWKASKMHPIKGVGYGNGHDIMYNQYLYTDTPLTWEIKLRAIIKDQANVPSTVFFGLLVQVGWIGIILLYIFFIKSIWSVYKIRVNFIGLEKNLLNIVLAIALNYVIISFYWGFETYPMMWFIFGLLCSFIYQAKIRMKQLKLIQKTNTKTEVLAE